MGNTGNERKRSVEPQKAGLVAQENSRLRRLLLIHAEIRTVWTVDHAVVVGAGIGGLTASLVLSRVAARVTLVERTE